MDHGLRHPNELQQILIEPKLNLLKCIKNRSSSAIVEVRHNLKSRTQFFFCSWLS
jgi:hypothetical protein